MNILLEQLEEAKRIEDEGLINLITQQILYIQNPYALKTETGVIQLKPYQIKQMKALREVQPTKVERLGRREALVKQFAVDRKPRS